MNPQRGRLRRLGLGSEGLRAWIFRRPSVDTQAQSASHAAPRAPVKRKAARHPQWIAIGVTMRGVAMAPSDAPLYAIATPRPRSSERRVCEDARRPAGKVAPSPKPRAARAIAN